MTDKQQWIDSILGSASNISRVDANPFLATRIESRLRQPHKEPQLVPMRRVYALALAMAVLAAVNITAWQKGGRREDSNGIQQLMQEYGWGNTDPYSPNAIKQ